MLGRPTPLAGVFLVLALLATSAPALASAQTPIPPVQPLPRPPAGPGRVVATISVLEGTVRMPGVEVELKTADEKMTLAKTMTDGAGQVSFPDVPPGRYFVSATRPGFVSQDSAQFDVRSGETAQVLLDINLAFTVPPVEVRASSPVDLPEPAPPLEPLPEPIESLTLQPVSASDMLSGSLLDVAPLEGDDFQSLLPLLPGVVRGADGRLRIKGGHPTQGALQISSASLIDPSSGDFDLDLPGQSVESVEVLANPFAAEYGRFSTSITQIRTRRGTNEWEIKPGNLVPRFRKGLTRIRGFEPRFSVRGPLKRDRLFLAQDFQYRYVANPVKSLPDEPVVKLISVDSFTRVDSVLSTRHTVGGGVIFFPREIGNVTMDTFRPPEVAPDFHQTGASVGVVDRFGLTPDIVLESTFSGRWFEIDVNTDGRTPMTYAPETQSGLFFNDQEREVHSVQLVEALSISRDLRGEHVFKFGFDLQNSGYSGTSDSRTIEVRRLDESLAELTVFGGPTTQVVNGTELAVFAQDRWRVGPRLSLELGIRMDRDAIVERTNWSPRGGVSIGVMPDGRAILRGGVGKFTQRTPLNVGAFTSFETPVVSRFAADGAALGPPVAFTHVTDSELRTPEAIVGNVEWDQRFGRRFLLKVEYLRRHGSHEYLLERDPAAGTIRLSSTGTSRYWEAEATVRYLGGESRDVTVSYVRSNGTADLNNYDQFYGNLRNPILRANENNLIPTDVPHRVIARGTFGLPGKLLFAPVVEVRSGFPFSAVDEFQDFVGPRSRAGRLPTVATLDFQLSRNWRFKKYRFRAGIKMYNVFGVSADRDVQNNLTSPNYGTFYNPIERSVGFVFGSAR